MRVASIATMLGLLCSAIAAPSIFRRQADCPAGSDFPEGAIAADRLVPISESEPDRKFGIVDTGVVTPGDMCTIVNLFIPDFIDGESTLLKTCTLSFAFPTAEQASPHTLEFSGPGHFSFTGYLTGSGADEDTTYNNQPLPGPSPPSPPPEMTPGHTYTIATLPCMILPGTGGQVVGGALCSEDTSLTWYQTDSEGSGSCPLGFFVVVS
ncbi:hypothetical protein CC78DRAFT_520506 [Lojkania enalia]|uniref:Ubiquitin 3 binding protein But2 C-terminal domain-containing protein n=1 Tax=Lojkania enalia TaxID=147567 RepID=A0A9P4K3E9_9PLEO|nr:hypothetical protein CC78DRAFT_520506 [Didymosphaeria enalia]